MKKSMQEMIKNRTTEELKRRKKELYDKLTVKRELIDKYRHLILQIECNCSDFVKEYETLDRVIFFREGRVKVISPNKREKKEKELLVKKDIKDMTRTEQSTLLEQLLAIKRRRLEQSSA